MLRVIQIFLLSVVVGCGAQQEPTVVGEWQVSNFKANIPGLDLMMISDARDYALSCSYELKEDQTCKRTSKENSVVGTWGFNSDSTEIQMNYPDDPFGPTENYKLDKLMPSTMTWSQDQGGMGDIQLMLSRK